MTPTPPRADANSQSVKAIGIAGVVLGSLVALAVAALFLLLIGADRSGWPRSRDGYRTRANPGQLQAVTAVSRSSPTAASQAIPIGAPHTPQANRQQDTPTPGGQSAFESGLE
jgi:hypothetical protein